MASRTSDLLNKKSICINLLPFNTEVVCQV
jgi:hypothetical protein